MVSTAASKKVSASRSPANRARVASAAARRAMRPWPRTMPQSAQMLLMGPSSWTVRPARSRSNSSGRYRGGICRTVRVNTMRSSGSITTVWASHMRRVNRAARWVQSRYSRSHSFSTSTVSVVRKRWCSPARMRRFISARRGESSGRSACRCSSMAFIGPSHPLQVHERASGPSGTEPSRHNPGAIPGRRPRICPPQPCCKAAVPPGAAPAVPEHGGRWR